MVLLDDAEGIEGERPQVVDAPADAGLPVGVVLGDRGTGQRQAGGGVVVGAAAQAGAAAVPVGVVVGQPAAIHRGRGREQIGDAAAQAVAAAAPLGLVVIERAIGNGDHAGVQGPEGGVVIPQEVEDAATRAETGEDSSGAAGRVTLAAAGLAVVQLAAADAGRAPQEIRNASADPGPDQGRHACSAGVVVAAEGIVVRQGAVADRSGGGKESSAEPGVGRASQGRADQDHSAATGVAVTADGLIVVQRTTGNGSRTPG